MFKKIIICCDGTWNKPGQLDRNEVTETNVQKIFRLISKSGDQVRVYNSGVGSGFTFSNKIFGGGFGSGINDKIREAYRMLVELYEYNDEIYLFGFSRGAYTARSLAGMIRKCGILKDDNLDQLDKVFDNYRCDDVDHAPESEMMKAFRSKFCYPPIAIKFIGVWDTVGALGIPLPKFSIFNDDILETGFYDCKLSSHVENAFQALAIDEKREMFDATLWQKSNNPQLKAEKQRFEQVWFRGVHSNIGGGYDHDKLCNISLLWMIEKAIDCGLAFNEDKVIEQVVDEIDFLFDAEESYLGFYKIFSPFSRRLYKRRDTNEKIHYSVIECLRNERIRYRPENLLHALGLGIPIDNYKGRFFKLLESRSGTTYRSE